MKHLLYRPLFWITFIFTSIGCAFVAYTFFPKAFSIINVPITMDRSQALNEAKAIASSNHFTPLEAQETAIFQTDYLVQFFVELDAGGKEAFEKMMRDNLYQPYTWQVRFYQEYEPAEAHVVFTCDGKPYGFTQTLSKNAQGAKLEADQARAIAEHGASNWNVDLSHYKLIESAKEIMPSGRIDHTFTYERPNIKIGEGHYRLRLKVSGDKFSELTHFVQVPETFIRKYTQMRSTNDAIAFYAKIALLLLYFLGGCIFGLLFLIRRRFLIWRTPIIWGLIFTCITFGVGLNNLPLAWAHYDTAVSASGYLVQYLISFLITAGALGIFFSIIFVAAESLTRYAFGNQIQLWRIWDAGIANSLPVLGRTIGAYLVVPIFLAFAVTLYYVMHTYYGWWSPASSLFDPNILASYLPWFNPLAQSLQAGFWEECMFRAVPLSCAAILGNRYGKRGWWIAGAMILQALIFGAGHANYPAQPAISRVIELFVPSLMFGGIYLAFGLLTGIITHFLYDTLLFSLPLIVATGHYALLYRALVVIGALVPVWIILIARAKQGKWVELSLNAFNRAWQPTSEQMSEVNHHPQETVTLTKNHSLLISLIGIGSIIAWYLATPHTQQAQPLTNTNQQAITVAQDTFKNSGIDQSKPWQTFATAFTDFDSANQCSIQHQHRFVWQVGGQENYQKLIGTYLESPYYQIRFAQFEGELIDRAQELVYAINNQNQVLRIVHQLAESQPGVDLDEKAARIIAHTALQEKFGLNPENLIEISATPTKRPARKDWVFIFEDSQNYPLNTLSIGKEQIGQARICIAIAGDQVTDYNRYIQVPEQWERNEKNHDNQRDIISLICLALIYLIFFGGCALAASGWSSGLHIGKTFLLSFMAILALQIIDMINNYSNIVASTFNTSQPFQDQFLRAFGSGFLKAFAVAAALALVIAYINRYLVPTRLERSPRNAILGLSIGALFAAAQAIIKAVLPSLKPLWAQYEAIVAWNSSLDGIATNIISMITLTLLAMLIFVIIDRVSQHGTQKIPLLIGASMVIGFALSGLRAADDPILLMVFGISWGMLIWSTYLTVLRYDTALIPLATAAYLTLQFGQQMMYHAFPGAISINAISIIIVLLISWWWYKSANILERS